MSYFGSYHEGCKFQAYRLFSTVDMFVCIKLKRVMLSNNYKNSRGKCTIFESPITMKLCKMVYEYLSSLYVQSYAVECLDFSEIFCKLIRFSARTVYLGL